MGFQGCGCFSDGSEIRYGGPRVSVEAGGAGTFAGGVRCGGGGAVAEHSGEAAVLVALAAGPVSPVTYLEALGFHGITEFPAYDGFAVGCLSRVEQPALERGRFGARMFAI